VNRSTSEPSEHIPVRRRPPMHRGRIVALAGVTLIVVFLAWIQPHAVLDGCDLVGLAICHQIPERSFEIAGRPLPLCARCTGTFLGALLGFSMIVARRRTRCRDIPPIPVSAVLVLSFVAWGVDGLNSYFTLLGGSLPHLYHPHNTLRLITGMGLGVALSSLVYPVLSMTLWIKTKDQRSIENFRELGVVWLIAGLIIVVILSGWGPALYLASVLSTLGVLAMLLLVNTLIAIVVLRRENRATRWSDLWLPAIFGSLGTASIIALMVSLRTYLINRFGMPF
jgi:uncharacterized membrane protein